MTRPVLSLQKSPRLPKSIYRRPLSQKINRKKPIDVDPTLLDMLAQAKKFTDSVGISIGKPAINKKKRKKKIPVEKPSTTIAAAASSRRWQTTQHSMVRFKKYRPTIPKRPANSIGLKPKTHHNSHPHITPQKKEYA